MGQGYSNANSEMREASAAGQGVAQSASQSSL
jgi:hypothetical protein